MNVPVVSEVLQVALRALIVFFRGFPEIFNRFRNAGMQEFSERTRSFPDVLGHSKRLMEFHYGQGRLNGK